MGFVPDPTRPIYGEWTFGYLDGYQAWLQKGDPSNTLDLDFSTGGPLDSRVTFTRSSTATFVGSNGLIQTAAINAPRFAYHPSTLQPMGLLIESARTNMCIRSEDWTDAGWAKTAATITANATTDPAGTTFADALIDDATSASHWVGRSSNVAQTGGSVYVTSIFVKRGTRRYAIIEVGGGGIATAAAVSIDFDSNGALFLAQGTPIQYNVQAYLDGWYRVQIAVTTVDTTNTSIIVRASNGPLYADRVYAGTGTVAVYGWGAQIEAGPYASSYISNPLAVNNTRNADILSMTGTNFSSWYNPLEGSVVAEYTPLNVAVTNRVFTFGDGTGANRIESYVWGSNILTVDVASVNQVNTAGTINAGIINRVAVAYKLNDFASSVNGAAVSVDGTGTIPVVNQLNIGNNSTSSSQLNGYLKSLEYYNVRKDNAFLQAATAYPTSYYSLDFMTGVLDPRITYTRSTAASYVGSNGLIQTAAINTPRFAYHPITGVAQGFQVEWGTTNLALWSEDLTQSTWVKVGSSISGETVLAPDGTLAGDSLVENMAAASAHNVSQVFTPAVATYTWSAFLKRSSSKQWASLIISGGGIVTNQCVVVDFDAGTVAVVNGSPIGSSIQAYPGGWFKVSMTFTTLSTAALTCYVYGMGGPAYANRLYDGFGTTAVYIWGAQLEQNIYASSYIKTTSATQLRGADTAYMNGTNFTDWYNLLEGTFVTEYIPAFIGSSSTSRLWSVSDTTLNNRMDCSVSTNSHLVVVDATVAQGNLDAGDPVALSVNKIACAYKLNDMGVSLNGGVAVVDNVCTIPNFNNLGNARFHIGSNNSGISAANSFLRKLSYTPVRLTNAQLQALST